MKEISTQQIEEYQRDGVTVLRNFFSETEINLLREGVEENLRNPSPRAKIASEENDPGLFIEDFCNWQFIPEYRRFIFESGVGAATARLMRSAHCRLFHDHMLTKRPGTVQHTPWHQDEPYYCVTGAQCASLWIPLDAVSQESALKFVRGSHRGPLFTPTSFKLGLKLWLTEGTQELAGDPAELWEERLVSWQMAPGDALCFHFRTLHCAGGVESDKQRRAFSVRFLGEDCRHAKRDFKTSPHFPDLDLPDGAPMDHPLFPLLWENQTKESEIGELDT